MNQFRFQARAKTFSKVAPMIAMLMLAVSLNLAPPARAADELTIAAAADLTFAFKDIATQFQARTGDTVKLSLGSSGNFFSQIQNGAPYDLFFSADIGYAKKLAAAGLIEPGTLYEYAIGKIVLWVPNDSKLEVSRGMAVLGDPSIRKIAIANPEHAPYGRAAKAALEHAGLYDKIKDKIVLGENISQTAQFVQSGNADIGIVALSLALAPTMKDKGRYFEIPADDYPAIEQAAVVLKSSKKKDLAKQFLAFLKQPATIEVMQRYGFVVPR